MAEYGRVGSASDYMQEERLRAAEIQPKRLDVETSIGMQTSILKVKESKVTTIDFGFSPFKVEQFRELARLLADFPPGARVEVEYGEYHDEESLQIKVTG